jgi:hypothetical protein
MLRCDGDTTRGQCPEILRYPDYDQGEWYDALSEKPEIDARAKSSAEWFGWLVVGERLLCPAHVESAEFMVRAMIEGLPFENVGEL